MIRTENFAGSTEDFAAGRKKIVESADKQLRPHIQEALSRIGLPSWEQQIVAAALEVFDTTARAEVDEWSPIIDDMRDLFAKELGDSLLLTKKGETREVQLDTITGWVASMSVNAGTEAATTSDPNPGVGLEWITMHDSHVRSIHQDASGQTVPTGQPFSIGDVELMYPGQPVGSPENWINCRCVARPTMLTEASSTSTEEFTRMLVEEMAKPITLTASADKPFTSSTIMALPAQDDPIHGISSEADGAHVTLAWLGEASAFDPQAIKDVLKSIADAAGSPVTDTVSGTAVLGKDQADVVLLDAAQLTSIRNAIVDNPEVRAVYNTVEQFPNWLPHLTLGYPDTPRLSEEHPAEIRFDRIALWHGEDRSAIYHLGGNNVASNTSAGLSEAFRANIASAAQRRGLEPDALIAEAEADFTAFLARESKIIHAEDAEFTQEMADATVAAVPEKVPAGPAPAAEAPAAALRPWHGVLAPEGAPSGDKRGFAAKMLTMRDLPLPLKAQFVDDEGHKGSVVVGRIDEVYRDGGLIKAAGVWDSTLDADRAWGMIDRKMWRGVSVDLDAAEGEMVEAAEDGGQPSVEFTQGRVCSSTLCAIPAFAEAFIRNGTWAEFANEPMPSGAMVEIPDWATAEKAPALTLVASAAPKISADYFTNPMLEGTTALTLGEDGHIFGHLGAWEACHIAYEVCTTVPPSETDYAYFLTGQVFTDAGPVAVGQITLGGGHADGKLGVRGAMSHYDNTGTAVADITVGEDAHGVWFSGKLRNSVTDEQVHELFAAGLSGDWRGVRFRGRETMELVAALAVNVQGFPIPRAKFAVEGTRQLSLVAAGVVKNELVTVTDEFRTQMAAYTRERERSATAQMLRSSIRSMKSADIKSKFTALKEK